MQQMIADILTQYGSTVTLRKSDGTEQTLRAFIQPVTAKSLLNMRKTVHDLGQIPTGQFVYIGPPEPCPGENDLLLLANERYAVRRCELLMLADEPLYRWGLLVKVGGDDPWNN